MCCVVLSTTLSTRKYERAAMANGEQVQIVRYWSDHYRHLDLAALDLSEANLSGVILRGAHMPHANLTRACLDHADLAHVTLSGASARAVVFFETDLSW